MKTNIGRSTSCPVILLLTLGLLTAVHVSPASAQDVISVNFTADSLVVAPNDLAPAHVVGFLPRPNWNNTIPLAVGTTADVASPAPGTLVDHAGLPTDITLTWDSGAEVRGSSGTATPDELMYHGVIEGRAGPSDPPGRTGPTIEISNIPQGIYDLLVYVTHNTFGPPIEASMSDGTSERFFVGTADFAGTGYVEATATTLPDAEVATYVHFRDLTSSSVTLTGRRFGGNRVAIAGLQVVHTPTPIPIPPAVLVILLAVLTTSGAFVLRRMG